MMHLRPLKGAARLSWPLRAGLASVLLWAGAGKALDTRSFYLDLTAYALPLPDFFLRVVAITLPYLEGLLGLSLLANVWPSTVRRATAALGVVFIVALAQAHFRGLDIGCGCFGSSMPARFSTTGAALLRALLFTTLALALACLPHKEAPPCRPTPPL